MFFTKKDEISVEMKIRGLTFLLCLSATLANPFVLQELALGNHKFSATVYRELLATSQDNFLVSPLSAQLILSLSQSGAKHETAQEIRTALKLPHCRELVDRATEVLLQDFQDQNYSLHAINKIYVKKSCPVRREFLSVAQKFYGAQIESIDFSKKDEAAGKINRWVEEETDHKIRDLINPEILNNNTRALLINALRFRANWTKPFQFFSTLKEDFNGFGGVVKVDTMHIFEESFDFYEKPGLNATFLELPIEGDNVSMTVVLPDGPNGIFTLEERIDEVLEGPRVTHREMFNVALPKFKMESRIDFKEILQNIGVKRAFEEGKADFSRIAGDKGELFIDDVVQKTFVDVNEDGLEAAVATYVVKIANRNSETPREFIANRPFIFFVKVNSIIVFLGRVLMPYY